MERGTVTVAGSQPRRRRRGNRLLVAGVADVVQRALAALSPALQNPLTPQTILIAANVRTATATAAIVRHRDEEAKENRRNVMPERRSRRTLAVRGRRGRSLVETDVRCHRARVQTAIARNPTAVVKSVAIT